VLRHSKVDVTKPTATIILRNPSGKYAWRTELNYHSPAPDQKKDYSGSSQTVFGTSEVENASEEDKKFFNQLMELLDPSERRRHETILQRATEHSQSESRFLKQKNYGLNCDIAAKKPELPVIDESAFSVSASRLFLSHLGFLSLANHKRFFVLQPFDSNRVFDYLTSFKNLDKIRERECYEIGIIYVKKGQMESEIYQNTSASKDFNDFLDGLGWKIKMSEHRGFKGVAEGTNEENSCYYATFDSELLFHVAHLIPSENQQYKRKVLISWVEDLDTYDLKGLDKKHEFRVNIMIQPLPSGLYRIKIVRRNDLIPSFGPLLDEMVVSKDILAITTRHTAVNASKVLRDDKNKPFMRRRQVIHELCQTFQAHEKVNHFYAAQFQ